MFDAWKFRVHNLILLFFQMLRSLHLFSVFLVVHQGRLGLKLFSRLYHLLGLASILGGKLEDNCWVLGLMSPVGLFLMDHWEFIKFEFFFRAVQPTLARNTTLFLHQLFFLHCGALHSHDAQLSIECTLHLLRSLHALF